MVDVQQRSRHTNGRDAKGDVGMREGGGRGESWESFIVGRAQSVDSGFMDFTKSTW